MSLSKLRREIADANRELARVRREVEELRMKASQERKRIRDLQAESKSMINTVDRKNVYLSSAVTEGHQAILMGRIEGERFVWHKPYLEMYRVVE